MEMNNPFELETGNVNDFGFIDFMDEANFEQFIELIRGENAEPAVQFCPNYDFEHISGCLEDSQIGTTVPGELFDFNINVMNNFEGNSSVLLLHGDNINKLGLEENEGDESSATTTTNTTTNQEKRMTTKTDRSKTLISERKRRGRMKEKLYALRSLVPNITKMDKASIIGDAVLYIQDLQTHAKTLKSEIVSLETSLTRPNECQERSLKNAKKFKVATNPPVIKKILQMEVFQLEERQFFGRIVCNKGQGIAGLLYKALESLTSFKVHSSNLAAEAENYVLTFTLHVEVFEMDIINLPNFKLWIASAFLNLGFDFLELPQV